jgi:hypothetical protein
MPSNIRFRVHTYSEDEEDVIPPTRIIQYTDNPADALFSMLEILGPIMNYNIYSNSLRIALNRSDEDQELSRQEDVVVNVTSQRYNTTTKKFDSCSICQEKYINNEMVSVLKCEHIYHTKCIKEWGHYNPSCPVCKEKIATLVLK